MSVGGRDALKEYFSAGNLPLQEHFHALVDSMLHMEDEGFRKTPEHGLEISSEVGHTALLSLGRREDARDASWTLEHGQAGGQLKLDPAARNRTLADPPPPGAQAHEPQSLLTLDARRRVGINVNRPRHALHVDGVIGSRGRAGTHFVPDRDHPPLADGQWHTLAGGLSGCVAFEVVASTSRQRQAHAMLHATALNACNPGLGFEWLDRLLPSLRLGEWLDRRFNRRKRIRTSEAWWGARCDRLELAWRGDSSRYELAIRSRCDYTQGGRFEPVPIHAHVTQLWPTQPQGAGPAAGTTASPTEPEEPDFGAMR